MPEQPSESTCIAERGAALPKAVRTPIKPETVRAVRRYSHHCFSMLDALALLRDLSGGAIEQQHDADLWMHALHKLLEALRLVHGERVMAAPFINAFSPSLVQVQQAYFPSAHAAVETLARKVAARAVVDHFAALRKVGQHMRVTPLDSPIEARRLHDFADGLMEEFRSMQERAWGRLQALLRREVDRTLVRIAPETTSLGSSPYEEFLVLNLKARVAQYRDSQYRLRDGSCRLLQALIAARGGYVSAKRALGSNSAKADVRRARDGLPPEIRALIKATPGPGGGHALTVGGIVED